MTDLADGNHVHPKTDGAPRVLVVEDNGLIASRIVHILNSGGYTVAGTAGTLATALKVLARSGPLDAAMLDIDLRGEPVYPLAEKLQECGVPFLFLTGYEPLAIPDRWRDAPRVEKPFEVQALLQAVRTLLAGAWPPSSRPSAPTPHLTKLDRRSLTAVKTSRELITEARIIMDMCR